MGWFKYNIFSLLPQLYKSKDNSNDIEVFFKKIVIPVLDYIKKTTDNFCSNLNIETAHEKYLQLIGEILGIKRNNSSIETYKQQLRQAIPAHKRKGSNGALITDLSKLYRLILVEESFIKISRFNKNNILNKKYLAGPTHNHNLIVIHTDQLVKEIKEISQYHRPAGVNFYYIQYIKKLENNSKLLKNFSQSTLKTFNISFLRSEFKTNLGKLNKDCFIDSNIPFLKFTNYLKTNHKFINQPEIIIALKTFFKINNISYLDQRFRVFISKLGQNELSSLTLCKILKR